jgi:serine/threonine protein kinase
MKDVTCETVAGGLTKRPLPLDEAWGSAIEIPGALDVPKIVVRKWLTELCQGACSMSTSTVGAGSRVGPYEILSLLGRGGMREVYRARDPRLGREVALKILIDTFASDPDRLARFQREAQLLASSRCSR